jgi:SAM-dependent methyltransferase
LSDKKVLDDTLGTVRTLNQCGRSTLVPNEYSQQFIEYAGALKGRVLDLGAAFGVASIPALERGAAVIANDIDVHHLQVLWERSPKHLRSRLSIQVGRFPKDLAIGANSLDAVHASNLLNFLRGGEILHGLDLIHRWLKPGGKFFSISGTPYAANIMNFIPVYQERKRNGVRWPGEIEDISAYSSHSTVSELPKFLHLLDDEVLVDALVSSGFKIEKSEMYLRAGLPSYLHLDGRENIGVIAHKAYVLGESDVAFGPNVIDQ